MHQIGKYKCIQDYEHFSKGTIVMLESITPTNNDLGIGFLVTWKTDQNSATNSFHLNSSLDRLISHLEKV